MVSLNCLHFKTKFGLKNYQLQSLRNDHLTSKRGRNVLFVAFLLLLITVTKFDRNQSIDLKDAENINHMTQQFSTKKLAKK